MGKALTIAALASLLLTLAGLMTLQLGVADAQSAVTATPDYEAVTRLRLPWDSQQVEVLTQTQNWRKHWPPSGWGAVGLGWDFAPSVTPTPSPGITILLPTSGYLFQGYHPAPSDDSIRTGYGHYVDVVASDAGRAGWAVRLAHMGAEGLVADEYACGAAQARGKTCTPVWVPRGVPVGVMSNSGANYSAAKIMGVHLHMELGMAHEGTFAAPAGFSSDGGLDQLMFEGVGPFGMDDTQLNSDGRPAVSANQTTYRPRLRLIWPLSGAVLRMSDDRDYEIVIETEEWSSLHEYRWELTRAGGTELVSQGGWQRGQGTSEGAAYVADLSAGAATLGRGKYEWRAWVRFPDIRAGYAGEYFEGESIDGSFEILDTSRVLDWLRWQAARIKGDAIAASIAEMHENPPPPLPTPEYLLEEERPVVTHGATAEPSTRPSAEALITRVSVASGGIEANNGSYQPSISADGRYVAFESGASNLVDGDTNGAQDVFVHDRHAGRTTRVSVSSHGAEADDGSYRPAISADGRYVAFESRAGNLVDGDANGVKDVFVHDLRTATTTRVSVGSDGTEATGDESRRSEAGPAWPTMYSSEWPSISDDGRYVAFESFAISLVPDDTNDHTDVFVHDRLTGRTSRVSVSSEGAQANGESGLPSISGNGRFVVFTSWASNLVPDDTNDAADIFLHDIENATTVRVYVASPRGPGKGASPLAVISGDGRYIAFTSGANHLVPGDTNYSYDVFVFDRETSTTERVSVAVDGSEGMGYSIAPSISSDGLHVGFISSAFNLVHGDTNNQHDSFLRDRLNGTTTCVSTSLEGPAGVPSGWSNMSSLSADGRYVAFVSAADNLVGGDTNGALDVFVYERLPGESPEWGDSVDDIPVKLSPETLDQILIAYTCSSQGGHYAICLAAGDGSFTRTLIAEDWHSSAPVWSPDGEKLVYEADPEGSSEQYVLELASGVSTRLTHDPAPDLYPTWSPDGSRLAFISDRGLKLEDWEGGWDIYVSAPDASEERQLTDSPSADLEPYWSSDGTRIAFASWRDGDREVYVMNSDGSDQRNLSRNSGENDFVCGWLPGQSAVLYLNDHGYWAVDASGDAEPQPWTLLGKGDSCPIWSPDGRWLATIRSGDDETESILVMDADGRMVRNLTERNPFGLFAPWRVAPVGRQMSWSRSGSHIAVTICSDQLTGCAVYVLNTSGEVEAHKIGQGGDPAIAPY